MEDPSPMIQCIARDTSKLAIPGQERKEGLKGARPPFCQARASESDDAQQGAGLRSEDPAMQDVQAKWERKGGPDHVLCLQCNPVAV